LKKTFPDWKQIIYLDGFLLFPKSVSDNVHPSRKRVLEFITKYREDPDVQILLYMFTSSNLIVNKKPVPHHMGTVGTMVRFIPLFNPAIKYDMIWVLDVDLEDPYFTHMKSVLPRFESNHKTKLYLGLNTFGYTWKARIPDPNHKYALVGGTIVSKIQFPPFLINKFMEEVETKTIKWDKFINEASSNPERYRFTKGSELFPYGGDEWFLNSIVYDYLQEKHIPVMVEYRLNVRGLVKWLSGNSKAFEKVINRSKRQYDEMNDIEMKVWQRQTPELWREYRSKALSYVEFLFNQPEIQNLIKNKEWLSDKERAYVQNLILMFKIMKKNDGYFFIKEEI